MNDSPSAPIEVIIVAYGDPDPLAACLADLGGAYTPLVVDNSSLSATREVVERYGGLYLDPGRNLGFAAGVNYGLRRRRQPDADVLLLNPDATITPTAIERLHRELLADPRVACVAPAQVGADGEAGRVCWPFPSPVGAWLDALGVGALRTNCDFVIGAVLLMRCSAIVDIGWLDERFFLYSEEVDWQLRSARRGWTVRFCPDIVATHVGAGTGGDPTRRETHFHASHERLIRKHHGDAGWYAYRAANIFGAALRSVVLRGERQRKAINRLRLYARGPCRAEAMLTTSQRDT